MLSKLFKKIRFKNYKKGAFFAILKGKYAGEFWVGIDSDDSEYRFLSLPNLIKRNAPLGKVDIGINAKIIDFIQNLPNKVFKVCELQYKNIK